MMIKHMNSLQKLPLLLLMYIAAMLLLDAGGGDVWLAAKLYNLQGQQWLLQDHWLTEQVLHKGARTLNYVFCSVVLLLTLYRLLHYKKYPAKARRYAALSLSLIFSFALVAYLKSITNIACPWDLAMFGGTSNQSPILPARGIWLCLVAQNLIIICCRHVRLICVIFNAFQPGMPVWAMLGWRCTFL
nr:hypothetical protein [Rheinheimera baltica]